MMTTKQNLNTEVLWCQCNTGHNATCKGRTAWAEKQEASTEMRKATINKVKTATDEKSHQKGIYWKQTLKSFNPYLWNTSSEWCVKGNKKCVFSVISQGSVITVILLRKSLFQRRYNQTMKRKSNSVGLFLYLTLTSFSLFCDKEIVFASSSVPFSSSEP